MHQKRIIPIEIEKKVQGLIDDFNQAELKGSSSLLSILLRRNMKRGYSARFMGKYLYLDRTDRYKPLPICRLTWTGDMNNWECAIYRYSSGKYDSEEWAFPGEEFIDGTVMGAMKAGMAAFKIG
jgi:hypothetical protein